MAYNVRKMIDDGNNIKFVVFEKGIVFPEGVAGGMDHRQIWLADYYIDDVRDWLFTQKK